MASQFPKLPGYVVSQDPTIVNHKKISHVKLEQVRNAKNQDVPLYKVPNPAKNEGFGGKNAESMSYSHNQFPNHFGGDITEQFEPTYVKLDKQVSFSLVTARQSPGDGNHGAFLREDLTQGEQLQKKGVPPRPAPAHGALACVLL